MLEGGITGESLFNSKGLEGSLDDAGLQEILRDLHSQMKAFAWLSWSEAAGRQRPARGRALPDADGPRFVALNGRFQAENRSLIGHDLSLTVLTAAKRPLAKRGSGVRSACVGHADVNGDADTVKFNAHDITA